MKKTHVLGSDDGFPKNDSFALSDEGGSVMFVEVAMGVI
jgi:hypothetical protein